MYVPASSERMVAKTTSISVDSLVFDIEDGVAASQKVKVRGGISLFDPKIEPAPLSIASYCPQKVSRNAIGAAIATSRHRNSASRLSEHVVRVNSVDSGLLHSDLRAVFRSCEGHMMSPDAIMLPKVDTIEHLMEV